MGNSSPSETGLIKGCLNQIKGMFYWTLGTFAVLIAIVVGIMLWEDLDRAERTAERKKEEEKILAAEAKIEGFESVTEYVFNTTEAPHFFCIICGTHTHHKSRNNPNKICVNVACIDDFNIADYKGFVKNFDGINHPRDF